MPANSRHDLSPIRNHNDYHARVAELESSASTNLEDDATIAYCRELVQIIDNYMSFTEPSCKPQPYRMLTYLLTHVRPMSSEQAAKATGIADIHDLLLGRRDLTISEVNKLAEFFEIDTAVLID